ncbi:MAG: hypothetical protein HN576_03565 [Bacteriovoracaceae bacterium]|jgi:hypothetical protein|nr:hypothetical protein [Bacteriovoracaceae bacterium]
MKASITEKKSSTHEKVLIKLCHLCGELNETYIEPEKCASCKKAFLPSNYFTKIHAKNTQEFKKLFLHIDKLHEDELIKGYHVIW